MGSLADDELVVLGKIAEGNNGQSVRIAVTISAITLKPVRIEDIRSLKKNPGMNTPLVTIVKWLAEFTGAETDGNVLNSQVLTFRPKHRVPRKVMRKEIKISPGSMTASSMLHFQTILPLLLFTGGENKGGNPVELRVEGATNCLESPSYEYIHQIFLPAMQKYFGVEINSQLARRGWGQMTPDPRTVQKGTTRFKFWPLETGTTLQPVKDLKLCDVEVEEVNPLHGEIGANYGSRSINNEILRVVATIITPEEMHEPLKEALEEDIGNRFPGAEVEFTVEKSGHSDRVYVLLVGHAEYCRWGRDYIMSKRLRDCNVASLCKDISSKLSKDLEDESNGDCPVDAFLQDQLIIYQCLAEGRTCFPRPRKDQSTEFALKNLHPDFPLVEDSNAKLMAMGANSNESRQTEQARYVAAMMLPKARFYNDGKVCVGAAVKAGEAKK